MAQVKIRGRLKRQRKKDKKRAAAETQDFDEMYKRAHSLKSTAGFVGATHLSEVADQLQRPDAAVAQQDRNKLRDELGRWF